MSAYNFLSYNSFHRSIGMATDDVDENHEFKLWVRLYGDSNTKLKRRRLTEGAIVWIIKAKGLFEKGYMPNKTKEHFNVYETKPMRKCTKRIVYMIQDNNGEEVLGSWYPEELEQISNKQYWIERIICKRTAPDGSKEWLFCVKVVQ